MSFDPIASIAAAATGSASASAATDASTSPAPAPPGYTVISRIITPIMPPGYTQTQTTKADGAVTTVTTDPTGDTVDTIYGTSTMVPSESELSLWA